MGALAELAGDEKNGEGSRTFVFLNEGHTLGNALKTIIARYPEVDFCGYTIPHPTEQKLHFRIQSRRDRAVDLLKRGLEDLEALCDHTIDTFGKEMDNFNAMNARVGQEST
ncbi:GL21124 [Drosophila persimilis]|uniref:DNA-directed RNA polymerases I and III subunit RPAC2 n=2 Tax=pseudoobscura subgroup TaxID=32358 RepID=Q29CK4_DROPS|nr:probable DNA-directed RNA polymerases I and III subunit RPAC2 [Drosophila pseudoobscura]XP_002023131.1 probable DNA-directed RNA polymerases I and III subunit RPAC2 [Drosophila persimilis]EDW27259.1 GL21124 [Drosophila persimilis]